MNMENFQSMDIKDLVLFGGGLFTVVIIVHGFWQAWRSSKAKVRVRIASELIPEEGEDGDLSYLRGELPSGGARPVRPLQQGLNFDGAPAPVDSTNRPREHMEPAPVLDAQRESLDRSALVPEPRPAPDADAARQPDRARMSSPWREADKSLAKWPATESAVGLSESDMDDGAGAELAATSPQPMDAGQSIGQDALPQQQWNEPAESYGVEPQPQEVGERSRTSEESVDAQAASAESPAEDLLVVNLFAADGNPYTGAALLAAMRNQGLKYGKRKIFHRIDPVSGAIGYSVANAVEPGYFDMGEVADIRSPGLVFFMLLPGPADPGETIEDLLHTAQAIADELGAVLKDERRATLDSERMHHYRERAAEYGHRQPPQRAGAMSA